MVDSTNPAGRLHSILSKAKSRPDGHKVRDVWAYAFDCDSKDDADISSRVVETYNLYKEVTKLIQMLPNINHQLYLHSLPSIERAFFPLQLNTNWQPHKTQLNDNVMTRLQFCAEELSKNYSEESIKQTDLESIRKAADDLFDEVLASNLDQTLRLAILEELERIRSSISMYQIKGAKGVKEALQATLGAIIANHEDFAEERKKNGEVIEKLGLLVDKLDSFSARALKLKKLVTRPVRAILEYVTEPDEIDSYTNPEAEGIDEADEVG